MLEEAYMADAGVSIELPTGNIPDLPSPPTTQAELLRPPFRKAFELSQRVEIKGLLDVRYSRPVGGEKVPKGRKIVASKLVHTYKGDEQEYCVKTRSRLGAKGFSQMAGVDYNETTSPTPAEAPVKMIVAVANQKGLPVYHLNVSQAFVQAPSKEVIFCVFPRVVVDYREKMCGFKSASTVSSRPVKSGLFSSRTKQSRTVCFSADS